MLYDAAGWVSNVRVSPDGRSSPSSSTRSEGDNNGNLKIVDTNGKAAARGARSRTREIAWTPRGDEVWSSGGRARAGHDALGKEPARLARSPNGVIADIARDGRVLLVLNTSPARDRRRAPTGDTAPRNLTVAQLVFSRRHLARTGRHVLFSEQNLRPQAASTCDGSTGLRRSASATGAAVGVLAGRPVWVLDHCRRPAIDSRSCRPARANPKSWRRPASTVSRRPGSPTAGGSSSSGSEPGHGSRLYVQDVSGGALSTRSRPRASVSSSRQSSPDGRSIVARGPDRRRRDLSDRARRAASRPRTRARTTMPLRWTPDGKSIFVYRPSAPPLRVDDRRRRNRAAHALEGAPASGSVAASSSRRPDRHRARRDVLRLLLSSGARRALPRDRAER